MGWGCNSFRTFLVVLLVHIQWKFAVGQQGPNRPPSFLSGGDLSRFTISEDTPVGTVIYRLKGSDPEQGELTYSISGEYFRVNKRTGDITLVKELDRENEASVDVIISLTDDGHGGEPETVSLRKEVLILDVNDNKPTFEKTPYSFKVSEKARVGSTVFSDIVITDEDFETNSQITLTCEDAESQIGCKFFSVTAERVGEGNYIGIITLAAPLDFEIYSHYTLKLKASDGLNVVTTMVAITVLDVQDQSPRFFGGPYVFTVKENSVPGTKVGEISVQDGDTGSPRDLQIKLIDDANNNYFRLTNIQKDSFTGTFSAVVETSENILDAEDEFIRENLGVYELTLEAREFPLNQYDTEPTLVTRVGLAVMIQDMDDHLPTFNPPEFTRILRIPYNPEESWTFPDFSIEVEDVDEEPAHAKFNLMFDWSLNIPTPVEHVFAFVTPSNANPTIQSKGIITIEVLNISLLQPGSSFHLEIGAYQNEHLVSKINIPMEVAPGPKVLPIFNNTVYRVAVPEDIHEGEVITRIAAKNGDEIPGITYSLIGVGSERFKVDSRSGEIRCGVPNCLDFERERNNFFLVRAKSGKGVDEEVYSLFYLDTQPKNDESPTFSDKNTVRRSVSDGTLVFDPPFTIKATDSDLNDQITYSVVDHSMNTSGIYIEPETGELRLRKRLSWAEGGEHKLTVTATDKSGKIAEQSVLLIVQPVQNIPPSFPYEAQSVKIPENTANGAAIFKTVAHDPDGQDAALRYYIESQPEADLFYIEETTGMIHLGRNAKLDYEEKQHMYPVIVRVQDEGKPSEIAKAIIEISITDVNDESPKFSEKNYVTDMSESFQAEHTVLKLMASDADEDSKLEFSISCPCQVWDASGSMGSKADGAKYFSHLRLDPKLGEITLVSPLEHKLVSVLEFHALVKDKNGATPQSDTATVTVYVTAAERLTPYFGEPWTPSNPWINVTIPEDMEPGRNVVTLNAWDYIADEEISNFELIDSDSEPFALEDNVLRVTSPLDYETRKNYMVTVKAIDSRGGESTAKLAIKISDVNDNAPVFNKPEYRGKVPENSEFPTPILTVEASDRDDPDNYGAVRYAITGPQSHLFSIDELAGVVQVAPGADIDREKDASHTIFVLALDTPPGGPFQRTTMATLKIQVTDKNDNDPYCSSNEHLVAENAPIGTKIGNVTCVDPDDNPKLVYNLRDETKLGLFTIDSKTGILAVAKNLRGRGRAAPYLVTVQVEDGKDRGVSVPVEIKIANLIPNDGRPHFVSENLTGEISEGAFRGTPIMHISAADTDSFDNGEGRLSYKLMKQVYPCPNQVTNGKKVNRVDEVDYFRVDEASGMLTLQSPVDREKHDCVSVLVSVTDSGTPPRSETQWYTIVVTDIDDGVPSLPKNVRSLNLIVNETEALNSVIFNYTGLDTDIFPNNRIGFDLTGGAGDYFKLRQEDDQSASLIVAGNLEKLEQDELTMVVKCFPKERKVPVADCTSKVHIRIRRNSPTSEKLKTKITEMIFGVATGVPVGNLIGNAQMPVMKKILSSVQMYHPNLISQSPTNVTEVVRIDSSTGDILVWDNLEQYQNGHLRVELSNPQTDFSDEFGGVKKKLKIFISPNDQLLSTDTSDFPKLGRWADEVAKFLNAPKPGSKINHGVFKILTFDHSTAPEGKTMICFQLLENENIVSQEKSLQLLNNPDVQDIFLKFTFGDELQKGCPQRPRNPARLTVAGNTGRFWVERSLVGIASVVAIATISAILILCLVNRQRAEKI